MALTEQKRARLEKLSDREWNHLQLLPLTNVVL